MIHRTLAAALVLAGITGVAHANTFVFQQGLNGYTGQFDTNLRGEEPDTIHGAFEEISIDGSDGGFPSQGLIRFDSVFGSGTGQIGADQIVTGATLTLNITSAGSGFQFHEMLQSWNDATITWNTAGEGIQANGIEAAATPLISLGANDSNSNISSGELVIDFTAAMQRAQAGNAPYGWAMLPWLPSGTNGVDFYSAEWVGTERPLLTVMTTPVPEPATALLALGGLALLAARVRRRV